MKSHAIALFVASMACGTCVADTITSSCEKPILPNKQSSEMVIKGFNKRMISYKKCVDQFASEQIRISNESKDPVESQRASDAAATAINEFNQLFKEVVELQGSSEERGITPINVDYKQAPPPPPRPPK